MLLLAISSIEWVLLLDVLEQLSQVVFYCLFTFPKCKEKKRRILLVFRGNERRISCNCKTSCFIKVNNDDYGCFGAIYSARNLFSSYDKKSFREGCSRSWNYRDCFAVGLILGGSLIGIIGDRFEKLK